jgi:DNA-binding MarR family transcriptional regulator
LSRENRGKLIEDLIYEIRASQTATDAFDDIACAALGINRTDARCLDILEREGQITAGRLAELSGLTTAAVTAVLDRLEQAGYGRRVRDETDRRRVLVELTPLMTERAEKIWGPLGEEARRTLSRLSLEQLGMLRDFFRAGRRMNEEHIERVKQLRFDG